ncbi:MAG: hypothetical protein COW11_00800 [Candidatus Omnitrophica bacterium CG12_big_fil_rev_8_21_14_0_65_43_15]|uniref:Uncharacterized protein n=1 Tax=Candidatus Taenaricola geysiri TaxID=1974752 RepID=A0A2J0LI93_9BACT|nr:MAG: hypothetical protein AUJ89_04290 [Candidatus Omnitrophica bacterium CG1_02_43_210]PIV11578.1 MAG: hypothetical protein COS48_05305 [Candidatus Omnitrophica bacterium CG03_land_8_20_14_0_80_43_22]PIW66919.1 MAG: hypothetical protein COW11_00800 [Candidatus Omnitrophica bacterium CG12_big_fil_rev_8_21_14_0_65_43_15]PIW80612.1 MAG: hypothetical protein COZ98_01395 [Candidatus Omnitrophica bacterium CG_4_8_14_3_um_filter_43_15]PIY84212.1 MAG: hypothetical protein COY77_03600 [Candidatus Omn
MNIASIKKRYNREWLLIAVDKMNEATTTPISGKLIVHSPRRDDIYRKLLSLRKKRNILVEYSEDKLSKGFAVAFYMGH